MTALVAHCVCAAHPSEEEVRDFCSLLSLADRVRLASADPDRAAARLLGVCLDELGFPTEVVDAGTMHSVQRYDTLVVLGSLATDPDLMNLLRPVLQVGAVLLAVTVGGPSALLRLADAALINPPSSRGGPSEQDRPQVSFDGRSIIAVDAIRRDLVRRQHTVSSGLVTRQHRHLLDVSFPAAQLPEQLPTY
jgi:DNA-binding MurR/RpiR family transcriptional regulator